MATTTSRIHPGVILALVCGAQFMVVLDIAIVNVALPSIQQDLDVGQSTLQWVVIAYGLLLGGFLLLGGRMADLLGRRRILLTGLTIFTAASLVAGIAPSSSVLIAARGFQGFGAALVAPAALSILAVTFAEGQQRNRALGIFGAVAGTSASVGVIASGLLTDGPGWRWVFFINIPVGIVLISLASVFLVADRRQRGTRNFDLAGATTVTAGLLLVVYGLTRGAEDGWTAITTLLLFAVAALLLASFVWIEARSRGPLIPSAALRHRTLVAANLSAFFAFSAFFSFIFLATLLMQQVLGYSPTKTGVAWLATSMTAFVASAVAGARLVALLGVRTLLVTGLSLLTLSMLWLTRVPADANYVTDLLPAFVLAGVAIGLCAPSVQIGALSGVSESTSGLASGLVETMREIGGAAGVAAVSTVLVSTAGLDGFRAAFVVIAIAAALGALVAGLGFRRRSRTTVEEPLSSGNTHRRRRRGARAAAGRGASPITTPAELPRHCLNAGTMHASAAMSQPRAGLRYDAARSGCGGGGRDLRRSRRGERGDERVLGAWWYGVARHCRWRDRALGSGAFGRCRRHTVGDHRRETRRSCRTARARGSGQRTAPGLDKSQADASARIGRGDRADPLRGCAHRRRAARRGWCDRCCGRCRPACDRLARLLLGSVVRSVGRRLQRGGVAQSSTDVRGTRPMIRDRGM